MNIKWVFALIFFMYSIQTFSVEIPFNEAIEEALLSQTQLAAEIRSQLVETQRKTPEQITVSETVSLEGSLLTVYNFKTQH